MNRGEYARGVLEERRQAGVTVTAAVFSPCGQFLICASDSGRLALWELAPFVERDAWSGPERCVLLSRGLYRGRTGVSLGHAPSTEHRAHSVPPVERFS